MSESNVPNPAAESKPKRAKLSYSQLKTSLYSDPRYKHLLMEFGSDFAALLPRTWNALAEATNARILKRHIGALAYDVSVNKDKAAKILEAMIAEGFVYEDGEYFTSDFIAEKQEKVATQREEWRIKKGLQREGWRRLAEHPLKTDPNVPGDNEGTLKGIPKDSFRSQPQPQDQILDHKEMDTPRTVALKPDGEPDYPAMMQPELEPINGQPWTNEDVFMQTGRRPMRKWPAIRLTLLELVDIAKLYDAAGIPRQRWRDAFNAVQAKLSTPHETGRKPKFVSAYTWLTGFAKDQLLETLTKETRFKNVQGAA